MGHPPQNDDPIIVEFEPVEGQWGLNDANTQFIDSRNDHNILHNYCEYINDTPLEVFRYLIETKGFEMNTPDKHLYPPIYYALHHFRPGCDPNILLYLLSQDGVDINIKDEDSRSLLHWACQGINSLPFDIFTYLIETKGCDVNVADFLNNTPLSYALIEFKPNDDNAAILIYLLRQKALNSSQKGQNGCTLLHLACQNINALPIDIFKCLIETSGANINTKDNYDKTPLHNALIEFKSNHGGDIAVLTYLFNQNGIDANTKDNRGWNLFFWACYKINTLTIDVFKALIETHGSDLHIQDNENNTPFHCAFTQFDPEHGGDVVILRYLLTQDGINFNIKDHEGRSLLHLACIKINSLPIDVFKYLIEAKGAGLDIVDEYNNIPLHYAFLSFQSGSDSTILIYLLQQNGNSTHIKSQDGRTFLHLACIKINSLPLDVFKYLIEVSNHNVNAKDVKDNTPLHCALQRFKLDNGGDILSYLLNQEGIYVHIQNHDGCTPLHLACIRHFLLDDTTLVEDEAETDAFWCMIVETIIKKCIPVIFDGSITF